MNRVVFLSASLLFAPALGVAGPYQDLLAAYHELVALRAALDAMEPIQGPPGEKGSMGAPGPKGAQGGIGGSEFDGDEIAFVNGVLADIYSELDQADQWLTDVGLANDTLVRRSRETRALYDRLEAELIELENLP